MAQFWDGRAADLEAQAKGPVLNPIEMAMPSEAAVEKVLASIPGYVRAFKAAFPKDKKPVTYDNMAKAIGAFERKLVTHDRLDAFIAGKNDALTDAEKRGLKAFVGTGCVTCHNGPALGNGSYQKLGVIKPWPGLNDEGRSAITKNAVDQFKFKVPTLRNVAETYPYLHDGSIEELKEVVVMMARHQLGRELTGTQADDMVAFLGALTGEPDVAYIKPPELPASGKRTPKQTQAEGV